MVSRSSHTSHEYFLLVVRVTKVSFAIESLSLTKNVGNATFEDNFHTSKILVNFLFFNMAILLQIKL